MATSTNATDLITMIRSHSSTENTLTWKFDLLIYRQININTDTRFTILHSPLHVSLCPSPFHQRPYYSRSLDLAGFSPLDTPRSSRTRSWVSGFLFPWVALFASYQVSSEQIEERRRHLRKEASEDVVAVAANDLRQFGILVCDN